MQAVQYLAYWNQQQGVPNLKTVPATQGDIDAEQEKIKAALIGTFRKICVSEPGS